MKPGTKRIILHIVHLVSVIPVLGYVYQPVAEAAEYQRFTQMVFIPVAILPGYWMYMGFAWAVIGADFRRHLSAVQEFHFASVQTYNS